MKPPRRPASDRSAALRCAAFIVTLGFLAMPGDGGDFVIRHERDTESGRIWYVANRRTGFETVYHGHPDYTPTTEDIVRSEEEEMSFRSHVHIDERFDEPSPFTGR